MSGLRHAVVELLEQRSLSAERLGALEALQQGERIQTPAIAPGNRRFAWAAALLVAVILPALFWRLSPPRIPDADMARRIAEEVSANHLHLKPLEIKTGTIAGIKRYFTQLDFRPVDSRLAMLDGLDLIGGRYCSIQGLTAAQLRLQPVPDGPVQTLYQAPYERDRFGPLPQLGQGKPPLELKARGLDISIWVEKGILFALIRES